VSIETVLLVPVLFIIALIVVQASVVLHGISVANHVAAKGAMAAAQHGARDDAGVLAVYDTTTVLGARLARPPEISSSHQEVSVRVWVRLPRAVPFFAETISRQAVVPRERYVPYAER